MNELDYQLKVQKEVADGLNKRVLCNKGIQMKQVTIYEFLKINKDVIKDGYVAMDENCSWWWFEEKPDIDGNEWWEVSAKLRDLSCFNITPFDGDWKDSLIKVEHKEEE